MIIFFIVLWYNIYMKEINSLEYVINGSDFVKRIDETLADMESTRQDLYNATDTSRFSISNWKNKNVLPSIETAIKIANFLKVELEWLLTGNLTWHGNSASQPSQIYVRIYNLLKEKRPAEPVNQKELHQYIKDIVDSGTLFNWEKNRSIPDSDTLCRLAIYFGISLPFLSAGITGTMYDHPELEGKKIKPEEYDDFCNYKKNIHFMHLFDGLIQTDKDTVVKMIVGILNSYKN